MPVALDADEREAHRGVARPSAPGRRVRLVVAASAARSAACSTWRRATRRWRTRRTSAKARRAAFEALDTLRACSRLPALPRRIECFDISTLQGRETVASMVVCVEGRMRKGRVPEVQDQRPRAKAEGQVDRKNLWALALGLGPVPDDFAAMHEVVLRRYRRVLEQGGPFPDLDPDRRRQGTARGGVRGAARARARAARRRRPGEAGGAAVHARSRRGHRAAARVGRRCGCCSGFATRRIGSRSPSTGASRTKRDFRSELDDIAGIGAAAAQAAADGVRIGRRRPAREPRGTGGGRSARRPPTR